MTDVVESDCDIYHGEMERLFQGASSSRSSPTSSPATNRMTDDDSRRSYDKYKSRDNGAKQNGGGAVKRFSTSGGRVISASVVLFLFVVLSYLYVTILLSFVYDQHFDFTLT